MAAPKKQLTPDEVAALNEEFRDTEGDESEEGRRQHARARSKLRRLTHMETCSVCQQEMELFGRIMVDIDVPLDSCKKPMQINGKQYYGAISVYSCISQTLHSMIYENRAGAQRDTQGQDHTQPYSGRMQDLSRMVQDS